MDKTKNQKGCTLCDGSGWVLDEKTDTVRRCQCYHQRRREILHNNANIPERYRHCRLDEDSFQVPRSTKAHNVIHFKGAKTPFHAWDRARMFVKKYPDINKGCFFCGPPGVGKTHLAVGIIAELTLKKGVPCMFYDFQELMMEIRRTYESGTEMSEEAVLTPVLETEVLLLDDLGGMKVTDWGRDMLGYIINKRYSEKRITIITSNWMDEPPTPEDSLSDRIGIRLRSRLYEMCDDILIQGEDFRNKKKSSKKRLNK
jgi:DNA replication protein DnaC